jgi:hypothetical protein
MLAAIEQKFDGAAALEKRKRSHFGNATLRLSGPQSWCSAHGASPHQIRAPTQNMS